MFATVFAFLFFSSVLSEQAPTQRSIQVQVSQQQLHIQANSQNATHQDSYQFTVNLGGQNQEVISSSFQYQTQGQKNQTHIQFTLAIKSLFEYDSSVSGHYQGDAKSIVSQWPNNNGTVVHWQNWVDETREEKGITVYAYSATSSDGVFTIRVRTAPTAVEMNNVAIDPNNVKIDFEIHNYPYARANDTRVALHSHITSQTQSQTNSQEAVQNQILAFGAQDSPVGIFTWEEVANTTKDSVTVAAWSPDTPAGQFDFYFSFVTTNPLHPTDLVWDPRVGVDYHSVTFCIGSVCGGLAFVIITAVVVGTAALISLITCVVLKSRGSPRQNYEAL